MPNNNAPFGFRPIRHKTGIGERMGEYTIASGLAEDITQYDIVKSDGNGGIRKALAGDAILGVFKGVFYVQPNGEFAFRKSWIAGTVPMAASAIQALVEDDPHQTFEVQSSTAITAADIGQFVDLVDAVPDPVFETSKQVVGAAGAGTQFVIRRILEKSVRFADADNNTTGWGLSTPGLFALLEVEIVKHERGGVAMAVAV